MQSKNEKAEEYARLSSRIFDLKCRIAAGQERAALDGRPWDRAAGVQILELLKSTLAGFEARMAELEKWDSD